MDKQLNHIHKEYLLLNHYLLGNMNIYNASVKTYDYHAVWTSCDDCNEGVVNICKLNLLQNKNVANGTGYLYYAPNAFGSVTPNFIDNYNNNSIQQSNLDCD